MDKRNLITQKAQVSIKHQKEKNREDFVNKKVKIADVAEDMLFFAAIYSKEKEEILKVNEQ